MMNFFIKRHKWNGQEPDTKLWNKFKNLIRIEATKTLKCINLKDIQNFAQNNLFNLSLVNYSIVLNKYGALQNVQAVTSHGENLINLMQKTGYKHEHLQIIIHTKENLKHESKIIKGFKNRVSNTSQILELILDGRNELEKKGCTVSHITILHTHPSLEIMALDDNGTQVNFHALSPADLNTLKQVQAHFEWPITLSAITPAGIQYSCIRENICDS